MWRPSRYTALFMLPLILILCSCATIRITDPPRTADEEFLQNVATDLAISQISVSVLRDRRVYVDSRYLTAATQPSDEHQYLLGALRAKLLLGGARLTSERKNAEIVMEVRSQGISINHTSYLLGLPSSSIGGIFTGGIAGTTPEIALVKTEKQHGFASVAFVAYWADTGELVGASGPFVGRTIRDDYWFFGYGPETHGNIAPAQPAPVNGKDGN